MYMRDLWTTLARRWVLTLFCLAASGALVFLVAAKVPPTYESTADVVLVPPKSAEDPTANRYLSLSGLRQAVDVLTRSLGSDRTVSQIREKAPAGTFETAADFTTSAPIVIVTVKAPTADQAQELLDAVIAQVPVSLDALQKSVQIATKDQITPQVVAEDEKPLAVNKKQVRAIGAVLALALLASAMLVAAADNLLLRRKRARQEDGAVKDMVEAVTSRREFLPAVDLDWAGKPISTTPKKSDAGPVRSRR